MKTTALLWLFFAACTAAPLEPPVTPEPEPVPRNLAGDPVSTAAASPAPTPGTQYAPTAEVQNLRLAVAQARAKAEVDRQEHCKGSAEREHQAAEDLKTRARDAIAWATANCDFTVEPPFTAVGICPPTCEVIHLPAQSLYSHCRAEEPNPYTLRIANLTINGKLSAVAAGQEEECAR